MTRISDLCSFHKIESFKKLTIQEREESLFYQNKDIKREATVNYV